MLEEGLIIIMLPKFSGFLLKDQTKLYDNVAEFDSKHGRLSAMLNINPAPRIEWELEVIGESSLDGFSVLDYQNNVMPIEGHHFSIPEPYVTQSSSHVIGPINSLVGVTANAYYYYANRDYLMNRFIFLLPNFRIQEASMTGQEFIRKRSYKQEEPEEF